MSRRQPSLRKTLVERRDVTPQPVGDSADQAIAELATFAVPRHSLRDPRGLFPVLSRDFPVIDHLEARQVRFCQSKFRGTRSSRNEFQVDGREDGAAIMHCDQLLRPHLSVRGGLAARRSPTPPQPMSDKHAGIQDASSHARNPS